MRQEGPGWGPCVASTPPRGTVPVTGRQGTKGAGRLAESWVQGGAGAPLPSVPTVLGPWAWETRSCK